MGMGDWERGDREPEADRDAERPTEGRQHRLTSRVGRAVEQRHRETVTGGGMTRRLKGPGPRPGWGLTWAGDECA